MTSLTSKPICLIRLRIIGRRLTTSSLSSGIAWWPVESARDCQAASSPAVASNVRHLNVAGRRLALQEVQGETLERRWQLVEVVGLEEADQGRKPSGRLAGRKGCRTDIEPAAGRPPPCCWHPAPRRGCRSRNGSCRSSSACPDHTSPTLTPAAAGSVKQSCLVRMMV